MTRKFNNLITNFKALLKLAKRIKDSRLPTPQKTLKVLGQHSHLGRNGMVMLLPKGENNMLNV